MSLRSQTEPLDVEPTDRRSYRRGFHYVLVKRDREEAARKRREAENGGGGGGLAGPGDGVPADAPFPLANPRSDQWSISAVRKLWDLLTQGNATVVSLTAGRWTLALTRSQPAREALGLPVPIETVSQANEARRRNRNYAARVFGDASVSDAGGAATLTLRILTAYLTRSPNPLGLIDINDTSGPVHAGRLPQMFLRL